MTAHRLVTPPPRSRVACARPASPSSPPPRGLPPRASAHSSALLRLAAAALATNLLLVNVLFLSLVSAALYAARDRGVFSALLPLAALKICLPLQLGSDYFAPQSSSRWKVRRDPRLSEGSASELSCGRSGQNLGLSGGDPPNPPCGRRGCT